MLALYFTVLTLIEVFFLGIILISLKLHFIFFAGKGWGGRDPVCGDEEYEAFAVNCSRCALTVELLVPPDDRRWMAARRADVHLLCAPSTH